VSHDERSAWASGVIAIAGYVVYLALVLPQLPGRALPEVAYQLPLLCCIGGAIVAGIACGIVLGVLVPKGAVRSDDRDRSLLRRGDRIGALLAVLGAVGGLLLALAAAEPFWIANAIYLGFVLFATVSAAVRVVAYRHGR
jgi:hypothetical protein